VSFSEHSVYEISLRSLCLTGVFEVELLNHVSQIPQRPEKQWWQ